ncbi:hypothetical protein [Ruania alba]|uniref:Uncharacterized protein n=1 Tax=Ruania alba TaxID=648782 RepID=A0A1H5EGZ9_9MICO|nr:hypothetical protein [Ruania alba]SED90368.1 hypothetical protein SAMN04488554_1018 [Ruania alba]
MSTTDETTEGNDELATALSDLERLGDESLPEHVEAFERVHHLLQNRLAQAER